MKGVSRSLLTALGSGLVVAAVLIALVVLVERSIPAAQASSGLGGKLNAVQAKQIDLIVDSAKLYISWAFAVIALNCYFLKASLEAKVTVGPRDLLFCELASGIALASILFGQIALSNLIALLELDQFSAAKPGIVRYMEWQYRLLIASVVTSFASAHTAFWSVRRHADKSLLDADILDTRTESVRS
ncbi:MAG: hypothetical protein JWL61_1097 [Gemmatimonadetes bacterium]|nr:hypothetical protein [Gemmatimonadota bacterium]